MTEFSTTLDQWPEHELLDEELRVAQRRTELQQLLAQNDGNSSTDEIIEAAFDRFVAQHIDAIKASPESLPLLAEGFKTYRREFLKAFKQALRETDPKGVAVQVRLVLQRVREVKEHLERDGEARDADAHLAALGQALWASSVATFDLAGLATGHSMTGLSVPHAVHCMQEALTHFGLFRKAK